MVFSSCMNKFFILRDCYWTGQRDQKLQRLLCYVCRNLHNKKLVYQEERKTIKLHTYYILPSGKPRRIFFQQWRGGGTLISPLGTEKKKKKKKDFPHVKHKTSPCSQGGKRGNLPMALLPAYAIPCHAIVKEEEKKRKIRKKWEKKNRLSYETAQSVLKPSAIPLLPPLPT